VEKGQERSSNVLGRAMVFCTPAAVAEARRRYGAEGWREASLPARMIIIGHPRINEMAEFKALKPKNRVDELPVS
jgi:hypothetical protein